MYYSYRSTHNFNRQNFEKSKQTDGYKAWRKAQYAAQSGHCAWCYKRIDYKDMDADHIHPVGKAGYCDNINDFDNLVLACHECNRDLKKDSTYNEVAYEKALNKLTRQQKQDGYAPEKIYWERPKWIKSNKYCKSYRNFSPANIPESERNVWNQESPLVRNYSLRVSEPTYFKETVTNTINDNHDAIWTFLKWAVTIVIIGFVIYGFSEAFNPKHKPSTTVKQCDYSCQEAAREKYEYEEEKKRQKEREEEWEEAKRYWNCKNAGGSDYDCG